MLKIFNYFKKDIPKEQIKEIELSKIEKHMNLILREILVGYNKKITEETEEIEQLKENIMQELRQLHKKSLMNPNIPQREVQIMDGNRDAYVKNTSKFISSIELPKQYMELYDFSVEFNTALEQMAKDAQKNVFILNHFFANEIKTISKNLNNIEEIIINIRTLFEKHNIESLKEIKDNVHLMNKNLLRTSILESEIKEHEAIKSELSEKNSKLVERITTITSGTDYKALESFAKEKERADEEIRKIISEINSLFSPIETALKKYYYKNQEKKILKQYLDDSAKALIEDKNIEIFSILKDLKENIDTIDLKDKKRENAIEALNKLESEYLQNIRAELLKLEDHKQHIQTRITHNSASLNLSEQQYWINTNNDKIQKHSELIEKLHQDIEKIKEQNNTMKKIIRDDLEKLYKNNVKIIDDLQ